MRLGYEIGLPPDRLCRSETFFCAFHDSDAVHFLECVSFLFVSAYQNDRVVILCRSSSPLTYKFKPGGFLPEVAFSPAARRGKEPLCSKILVVVSLNAAVYVKGRWDAASHSTPGSDVVGGCQVPKGSCSALELVDCSLEHKHRACSANATTCEALTNITVFQVGGRRGRGGQFPSELGNSCGSNSAAAFFVCRQENC